MLARRRLHSGALKRSIRQQLHHLQGYINQVGMYQSPYSPTIATSTTIVMVNVVLWNFGYYGSSVWLRSLRRANYFGDWGRMTVP
jgi:hypothetical protein